MYDQIDAGDMATAWGTIKASCQRIETDPRWSTEGDWDFEGGGGGGVGSHALASWYPREFVKSSSCLHRCIGWISCETPTRTFGTFVADCAEVPKHSAIPYWGALRTRRSTEIRFRNCRDFGNKSWGHDIGLYLWMRLNRDSEPDEMDGLLEAGILRIIPEGDLGGVCVLLMY